MAEALSHGSGSSWPRALPSGSLGHLQGAGIAAADVGLSAVALPTRQGLGSEERLKCRLYVYYCILSVMSSALGVRAFGRTCAVMILFSYHTSYASPAVAVMPSLRTMFELVHWPYAANVVRCFRACNALDSLLFS